MKRGVPIAVFWVGLIVVLIVLEVAELTHFFTLPVQSALDDFVAFVTALVFTTVLAVVGAIFIGLYFSHRILAPGGFTPFEQEMLRMRREVQEMHAAVEELRRTRPPGPAPPAHDPNPRSPP